MQRPTLAAYPILEMALPFLAAVVCVCVCAFSHKKHVSKKVPLLLLKEPGGDAIYCTFTA